jgi:hypothetical protein
LESELDETKAQPEQNGGYECKAAVQELLCFREIT